MSRLSRLTESTLLAPLLLAVLLAGIYLVTTPHTADLAAQQARASLFSRAGDTPYWSGWYAGLSTVSYSLLSPALLSWLGAAGLGAVSLIGIGVASVPATSRSLRPTLGSCALVLATALEVFQGRTTFAMGGVFAVAAVAAVVHGRNGLAILAAVVATAASPVAGALLVVIAIGCLFSSVLRGPSVGLIVGVVVVMAGIEWYSRDHHTFQPFSLTSLIIAALTAAVAVVAPGLREVRIVAAVEIVALVAAYSVHSPVGSNVTRLAVLATAPAVVATARGSWRLVAPLAVAAAILPFAQLVNDMGVATHGDGSPAFVAGIKARLRSESSVVDHRVELVDTATHWPSTYLLSVATLARGWERQVDEDRNPEFYGRATLDAATYHAFLERWGVSRVVVPRGVPLDAGSTREAALIGNGLPYLQRIYSDAHWTEYAVLNPTELVDGGAHVVRQTQTGLVLSLPRRGSYDLRLEWSPTLTASRGKVTQRSNGMVRIRVAKGGRAVVHGTWSWPWHLPT